MSVFKFKYFSITQNTSAMKVGTDALLLGALVKLDEERAILDVGSGTGVVSLMCAQRSKAKNIYGIEIDAASYEECRKNYQNSPWANRLISVQGDINTHFFKEKFDLIISNPPYYLDALRGNDDRLNTAKHIDGLPPIKFFEKTTELLLDNGRIVVIVPSESYSQWVNAALKVGFNLVHQIVVHGKEGGPEKRRILTFSSDAYEVLTEDFTIRDLNGNYTNEYKAVTIDFHGVELK